MSSSWNAEAKDLEFIENSKSNLNVDNMGVEKTEFTISRSKFTK